MITITQQEKDAVLNGYRTDFIPDPAFILSKDKIPFVDANSSSDLYFAQFPDDPNGASNIFAMSPPVLGANTVYIGEFENAIGPALWIVEAVYPSLNSQAFHFFLPEGKSVIRLFSDEQIDSFISTFIGLDPFASTNFTNFYIRTSSGGFLA